TPLSRLLIDQSLGKCAAPPQPSARAFLETFGGDDRWLYSLWNEAITCRRLMNEIVAEVVSRGAPPRCSLQLNTVTNDRAFFTVLADEDGVGSALYGAASVDASTLHVTKCVRLIAPADARHFGTSGRFIVVPDAEDEQYILISTSP